MKKWGLREEVQTQNSGLLKPNSRPLEKKGKRELMFIRINADTLRDW